MVLTMFLNAATYFNASAFNTGVRSTKQNTEKTGLNLVGLFEPKDQATDCKPSLLMAE